VFLLPWLQALQLPEVQATYELWQQLLDSLAPRRTEGLEVTRLERCLSAAPYPFYLLDLAHTDHVSICFSF
jgi:hypothetical protein